MLGTGDYTSLGTEPELVYARQTIEGLTKAPLGFLTVPGNHDLYLNEEDQSGFDKYFGDVLGTDLPELSVDGVWPQVRLVGDSLAVVGINSARPNPQITAFEWQDRSGSAGSIGSHFQA